MVALTYSTTPDISPEPTEAVVIGDSIVCLSDIKKPDVELTIWRRMLPSPLQTWLERLDSDHLPDLRVLIRPGDLRTAISPYLVECNMPAGEPRDQLVEDIENLVFEFARITGRDFVDLRLECISHDSCWKFHRDSVETRLLTTYRGPATDWVQPPLAERALSEQKSFTGPLETLQCHDVAIFKGNRAGSGSGIVHRSPPIEGSGCTRLLLCLNEESAASPDPWPH